MPALTVLREVSRHVEGDEVTVALTGCELVRVQLILDTLPTLSTSTTFVGSGTHAEDIVLSGGVLNTADAHGVVDGDLGGERRLSQVAPMRACRCTYRGDASWSRQTLCRGYVLGEFSP